MAIGKAEEMDISMQARENNSSLGATKVLDVGDMLEQYGAQGFGVLTSTLIDATLYAKLDAICRSRGIEQLHMSVLELERALARNPTVKTRFFPPARV